MYRRTRTRHKYSSTVPVSSIIDADTEFKQLKLETVQDYIRFIAF